VTGAVIDPTGSSGYALIEVISRVPLRAALAILATVAGVVLLFSFRTPTPPVAGSTALPSTSASASAQTAAPCTSAVTAPPGGEGDDNGFHTPLAAPAACATAAPAPSAGGSTAPPTAASTQLRDGSYTGQDSPNQFGDVQVKAVISGGQLTDVQAVQLPSDRARSAFISQQAGPILRSEALQAHSAQIDIVSGATYTSQSYAASLQSALDQARA
jgi:uncharacterized protein with FMN-binding domain